MSATYRFRQEGPLVHRTQGSKFQHFYSEIGDRLNVRYDCVVSHTTVYINIRWMSDILNRGSWKNANFKKYNFEAEGLPTDGGALHPLLKVREEIRNIFLEMGYAKHLGITPSL